MFTFARRRAQANSPRPSRRRVTPGLDSLESRRMLDAKVALNNGVLTIDAINTNGHAVTVTDFGQLAVNISVGSKTRTQTFNRSDVQSIVYNGDTTGGIFGNITSIPAVIHGHGPGDQLIAGSSGKDVFTEDSTAATFTSSSFPAKLVVTDPDTSVTVTDKQLTSGTRNYSFTGIGALQLTLNGPQTSTSSGTVDLRGFSGTASVDGSKVGGRLDLIPGPGSTSLTGGQGFNAVEFDNVTNMSVAGNQFKYNTVTDTLSNINAITVFAGSGPITIDLNGFAGSSFISIPKPNSPAVIRGGAGGNTVVDNAGPAVVLPSANPSLDQVQGAQVQYLALPSSVSAPQRNRAGAASVFLGLDGKTLNIIGPTGAGFGLVSNWTLSADATGGRVFQASGTVTLLSPGVNLTFNPSPTSQTVVRATTTNPFLDYGQLVNATLTGLTLDTSAANSPLHQLETMFGLHADVAGATWNIGLGSNLSSFGLPLSAAVPYLVTSIVPNSGATAHASLAGTGLSATSGQNFKIAIDPSDPSIFAGTGSALVGASLQEDIPYTPATALAGNPAVFGNVVSSAANVAIGSLPVAEAGTAVLGLDVNHSSNLAGVTPDLVRNLLQDQIPLSQAFPSGLKNVALGVNGTINVGYAPTKLAAGATPIDLTFVLPVSLGASGALTAGTYTFAGRSASIAPGFASGAASPLSFLGPDISFISGMVSGTSPQYQINANLTLTGPVSLYLPNVISTQFLDAGITLSGNSVNVPIFGPFNASGTIAGNGDIRANGQATATMVFDFNASNVTVPGILSLTIPPVILNGRFGIFDHAGDPSNPPPIAAITFFSGDFNIPSYNDTNPYSSKTDTLSIQAQIAVTKAASGGNLFTISGTANGIENNSLPPIFSHTYPVSYLVQLNANQLQIGNMVNDPNMHLVFNPKFVYDLSSPAFPKAKLTRLTANGKKVALTGRVSEPDRTSPFTLNVNWGDGTPIQTVVLPAGSKTKFLRLTHSYKNAVSSAVPHVVFAQWFDNKGRTNSTELRLPTPRRV